MGGVGCEQASHCFPISAPTPFPFCGAAGLILPLSHTLDFSLCDCDEQPWAGVTGCVCVCVGVPLKCDHRPAILSLSLPLTPQTPACSFLSSPPGFLSAAFQNVFAETAFLLFRHLVLSFRTATAFHCSKYNYPPTPPLLRTHWILV